METFVWLRMLMVSVYVAFEKKAAPSGWKIPLEGWSAASSVHGKADAV